MAIHIQYFRRHAIQMAHNKGDLDPTEKPCLKEKFREGKKQLIQLFTSLGVLYPSRRNRLKPYRPWSFSRIVVRVSFINSGSSTAKAGNPIMDKRAASTSLEFDSRGNID